MIRLATSKDFTFFYDLYMHPDVNPFLLYDTMDQSSFAPIFNELLAENLLYVFEMENQAAGMFKFIPLKHRNSHIAYLGGLAIDPVQNGRGYGALMMQEIIALGKSKGLLRIELSTAVTNTKAVSLDVNDTSALEDAVAQHDVTISLIPYVYHVAVVKAAIKAKKHVVTTSYVSPAMQALDEEVKAAGITVMNEIGVSRNGLRFRA